MGLHLLTARLGRAWARRGRGRHNGRGDPPPTRGGRRAELLEAAVGVVAESAARAHPPSRGRPRRAARGHLLGLPAHPVPSSSPCRARRGDARPRRRRDDRGPPRHADDPDALAADVTELLLGWLRAPRSSHAMPEADSHPWRASRGRVPRLDALAAGRDRGRARDGDPDGGAAAHGIRRGCGAARRARAPRRRSATRSPEGPAEAGAPPTMAVPLTPGGCRDRPAAPHLPVSWRCRLAPPSCSPGAAVTTPSGSPTSSATATSPSAGERARRDLDRESGPERAPRRALRARAVPTVGEVYRAARTAALSRHPATRTGTQTRDAARSRSMSRAWPTVEPDRVHHHARRRHGRGPHRG